MVQRCTNPKSKQYKDYGGRGITVCNAWRDYKNFAADMGPRPHNLSLDRIDNDKGYSPENCRWATRLEQNNNKRNCIYIVADRGKRMSLKQYCEKNGLNYRAIAKRISQRNWPIDLAISLPVGRIKDGTHILSLWEQIAELKDYLSVMVDAVEGGRPIMGQTVDEARRLCGIEYAPELLAA